MKKIICIMGPTASGKTKLSIELAKSFGGEIINGDAVQVYRELNIGAAKITVDAMENVKHHLLDVVSLKDDYTVYHFQKDAREKIASIDVPIIVGGSGLYIKSVLYDYQFESFDERFDDVELADKIEFIKEKDPDLVLDWHNQRRVESAYRNIKSGHLRSQKVNKHQPLYDVYLVYLDIERTVLKERLENRLNDMIDQGFIQETKELIEYPLNIIGYREIKKYLAGTYSLDEAKNDIIRTSMRFAKRQRTWFINQMQPKVYDALSETLFEDVSKDIEDFLKGS